MAAIPDEAKHSRRKNFAPWRPINSDGSPQVSAIWIGIDGDLVTFNTAEAAEDENLHRIRTWRSRHQQENP